MIVHVRLHTILRKKTPEGIVDRLDLELGSEATVDTVLSRMDITITGRSVLLVLNGKLVDRTARLADGDELRLVPAISGGCPRPPGTQIPRKVLLPVHLEPRT